MSSENTFLPVLLDAPMMSWGIASRFERRATALHPTRSAILGMVCAALGAAKGSSLESDWLTLLATVRLTVFAIPRTPAGSPWPTPIRRLEDFHTVSGTRTAENKLRQDAVISRRQYLLDARFAAILEGPRGVLQPVADALRNPRWGIWFGRKCCIPAAPVLRSDSPVNTLDEAMARLGLADRSLERFTVVTEVSDFADGTDTLPDVPVSFETREFAPRRISLTPGTAGG